MTFEKRGFALELTLMRDGEREFAWDMGVEKTEFI
jgi:hypothetical protein